MRVKCTNRNCGWIGEEAEQRRVKISQNFTEMRCPRCDGHSFYEAQDGEKEKRKPGHQLIALERQRQIKVKDYTAEHDDEHVRGELADAAIVYADAAEALVRGDKDIAAMRHYYMQAGLSKQWPWDVVWLSIDADPISNLVKAGALIAAEIDRLQRLAS